MSRGLLPLAIVLGATLLLMSLRAYRANGQFAEPVTVAPEDKDTSSPPAVVLKRQHDLTDEDLRKELLNAPETGFGQREAAMIYKSLQAGSTQGSKGIQGTALPGATPSDIGPNQFKVLTAQVRKPEQFALPWRVEPDCSMGKEPAERLHVLSLRLRDCLRKSAPPNDVRPDPQKLNTLLFESDKGKEWKTAAAIPTLVQLLQVENTPVRLLMVELLADIDGKEASAALAQRATFDFSPEVREKAVQSLAKRPVEQYEQVLLAGLRYPWPAAAVHASEAITCLKLTRLTPDLIELLKEPSPTLPVKKKNDNEYTVKELVRVNHLCNCVLCHAPSSSKEDLIRGRVPMPDEDPPPLYYNATSGMFVRANTTYLRQDFSVVQPVKDNGKWAANQRYDYVTRVRPLNAAETKQYQQLEAKGSLPKTYPQRDAVLAALRGVTQVDAGDSHELWTKKLKDLQELPYDFGQKKK